MGLLALADEANPVLADLQPRDLEAVRRLGLLVGRGGDRGGARRQRRVPAGRGLDLDIERFRTLSGDGASRESLSEAVTLFKGDLLEGFSLRDSPDFEDWQLLEASALERELASALRRLVEARRRRGLRAGVPAGAALA